MAKNKEFTKMSPERNHTAYEIMPKYKNDMNIDKNLHLGSLVKAPSQEVPRTFYVFGMRFLTRFGEMFGDP